MPRVLDDILLPLLNRGLLPQLAQERALAALDKVGLREVSERPATQLSLGERKRAAIAAALAGSAELLLLDEPTAELDGRSVRRVAESLRALRMARLIASHDLDFLRGLCQRALVLAGGKIIAQGASHEILSHRAGTSRFDLAVL
jgi:cobalt/nickel transport system ATP-binding protein